MQKHANQTIDNGGGLGLADQVVEKKFALQLMERSLPPITWNN
jgi:hypothetical protein